MNLPPDLETIRQKIEGYAREYGLDFFETFFEILDFKQLNEVASFMGFPNRYPHWRFGMEYERLSKSYAYGLHKIYEMVINNDPCYANAITTSIRRSSWPTFTATAIFLRTIFGSRKPIAR